MRILLIGEFSGFYNTLAEGLKALGHNVFLANTGDGVRKFYSDYNWMENKKGIIGKAHGLLDLFINRKLFIGYDIVQVVVPRLNPFLYLNKVFVDYLVSNNNKVFWTPAGKSDLISKYWTESLNPRSDFYDFHIKQARKNKEILSFEKPRFIEYENWFLEKITGIIPVSYTYTQPFRSHKKFLRTIPFPINTDKIKYKDNHKNNGKILFYHGITRPVKGTEFILKAFDILRAKFNNDAEFICNKHIPYNEYIEIISKTNVVVDQVNSFSTGMNGLISLAQGKVVLSGADPIGFDDLGYKFCPIINVKPDIDQICSAITSVIEKNDLISMGYESRRFVEHYHNYLNVASEYLDAWNQAT